jgi:hypothetical protein
MGGNNKMKRFALVLVILFFGVFLLAGNAAALPTSISPAPGSEVSLTGAGGILDQIYGLGNIQRVDDSIDQVWAPASFHATARAKYAGFNQNFGYIPRVGGSFNPTDFVPLFNVTGNGIYLGPSTTQSSGNVDFLWALNPSGAPLWTSLQSQNSDGLDHMVTWLITGGPSAGNFAIGWEDLPQGGDMDFNDLVVEVGNMSPTPEPATMLLLGTGLIGLAGFRRKFKK